MQSAVLGSAPPASSSCTAPIAFSFAAAAKCSGVVPLRLQACVRGDATAAACLHGLRVTRRPCAPLVWRVDVGAQLQQRANRLQIAPQRRDVQRRLAHLRVAGSACVCAAARELPTAASRRMMVHNAVSCRTLLPWLTGTPACTAATSSAVLLSCSVRQVRAAA